jgi:hypothetical protein
MHITRLFSNHAIAVLTTKENIMKTPRLLTTLAANAQSGNGLGE